MKHQSGTGEAAGTHCLALLQAPATRRHVDEAADDVALPVGLPTLLSQGLVHLGALKISVAKAVLIVAHWRLRISASLSHYA